jgi:hypothetical protein
VNFKAYIIIWFKCASVLHLQVSYSIFFCNWWLKRKEVEEVLLWHIDRISFNCHNVTMIFICKKGENICQRSLELQRQKDISPR